MEDIRLLLASGEDAHALYDAFIRQFQQVIRFMCGASAAPDAPQSPLDYAVLACGYSAGCAAALKRGVPPVQ